MCILNMFLFIYIQILSVGVDLDIHFLVGAVSRVSCSFSTLVHRYIKIIFIEPISFILIFSRQNEKVIYLQFWK